MMEFKSEKLNGLTLVGDLAGIHLIEQLEPFFILLLATRYTPHESLFKETKIEWRQYPT